MIPFLPHFFGMGSEPEFALFTAAHLIPIVLMLAAIWLIRRYRRELGGWKHETSLRYVLAFTLAISEMSYYWRIASVPGMQSDITQHLPVGVCTWAAIFCSYMLIGKSQRLFDIVYFWLLSGSLFALITPTPLTYAGPTRFRYYQFWLVHTLGYVALFYMIFVHGMRPRIRSAVRSFLALLVLAVVAYWVNTAVGQGANYLFMARPEAAPSVLDILPANFALRISIMAAGILTLFTLAYLPWYFRDKKAAKAG